MSIDDMMAASRQIARALLNEPSKLPPPGEASRRQAEARAYGDERALVLWSQLRFRELRAGAPPLVVPCDVSWRYNWNGRYAKGVTVGGLL